MDYIRDIPVLPERSHATGRALLEGRAVHIPDVQADPEYTLVEAQRLGGYRTVLGVPMLREGVPIGVLALTRDDVRPFTDKQIELVQTFADQAAIAIENARLLNELRQRTADLTESLEQQTATADVLRIISSSPGELTPVFQTMLENATRICEAKFGMLFRLEDGAMLSVASLGVPEPLMENSSNMALIDQANTRRLCVWPGQSNPCTFWILPPSVRTLRAAQWRSLVLNLGAFEQILLFHCSKRTN
jgi:hypothetical protein